MYLSDIGRFSVCGAEVWSASFDDGLATEDVTPAIRNEYIRSATDPRVRRQRYAVWFLLDLALCERFGKGVAAFDFKRDPDGKWSCADEGVYFSLSHSRNAVAVALSDAPVGVDIEALDGIDGRRPDLIRRVLTASERQTFEALPRQSQARFFAEKWCAKEAVFKRGGNGAFVPSRVNVSDFDVFTREVDIGGSRFMLAVVGQ